MGATVLKLGSWNTITDAMVAHPASPTGAVLDLNDGQTWTLNDVGQGWGEGLDWGVARPDVYKAGNVRTVGQRVTRRNYGQNRQVRVHLFLGQLSSYSAYMTALHNLVATLEGISQSQPATLQVQVTGASSPVYLDCVEGHLITQYRELQLLQLLDDGVEVEFEARPFFRGPRQTLQNLCMNPGFEAPFGGGVATTPPGVFSDTFANTNAYSVVSGGAPSLSPANTYVDIVHADSPIRHYRLGETSGANAYDIGGMYQTGTYVAAPTLGAAGLIAGDTDPAVTLNGTTQYATIPTTGLPTGANPWSIEAWAKPSSGTAGGAICSFGDSGSNGRSVTLAQLSAGGWQVFTWGGTVVSGGTSAAGVIHHVVATFDGVNLRLFVDGALVAGPTAPGVTVNVSGTHAAIGALYNGSYGSFFGGTVDEVAIYGSALSAATITAHYNAGTTATTQVDMTSGTVYPAQSDSTTRQRVIASASFNTVTPSTTYYLYAQPDGTTYWSTANTPAANSLALAQVTTDGSGNVSTVTDKRVTTATLLPNAAGQISIPRLAALSSVAGQATAGALGLAVVVASAVMVHVTSTSQQTLWSVTPPQGLYMICGSVYMGNGSSESITFGCTNLTHRFMIMTSNSTVHNLDGTQSISSGLLLQCFPSFYQTDGTTTFTMVYQDPAGTPNDYVSAALIRVA